jgi:hypothetical protein
MAAAILAVVAFLAVLAFTAMCAYFAGRKAGIDVGYLRCLDDLKAKGRI